MKTPEGKIPIVVKHHRQIMQDSFYPSYLQHSPNYEGYQGIAYTNWHLQSTKPKRSRLIKDYLVIE